MCERGISNALLPNSYVAHALYKRQTRESKFHISRTASFKCWQVLSGKIKLYIHESGFIFLGAVQNLLYSRLSLSRIRRDPQKHFEIFVLRHIRFVVLNKKQLEQTNFTNDYVI